MIGVKEAVQKAVDYLREVSISGQQGLRVEEVEKSQDGKYWLVTLGFLGDELLVGPTGKQLDVGLFGQVPLDARPIPYPRYRREYRVFRVRAEDGEVEDMRIKSMNGDR